MPKETFNQPSNSLINLLGYLLAPFVHDIVL